jgi:hypothetical protein
MTTHPQKVARFTLIVKKFKDIFTTPIGNRGTLYRMTMDKPHHPLVEATEDKNGYVKKIKIGPGRVTLRFQIAPEENNQYRPVGIAFVRKVKRRKNKLMIGPVLKNFPPNKMNLDAKNCAVSVTADFSSSGGDGKAKFEFFLIIQRDKPGDLGIIDPPLDHEH